MEWEWKAEVVNKENHPHTIGGITINYYRVQKYTWPVPYADTTITKDLQTEPTRPNVSVTIAVLNKLGVPGCSLAPSSLAPVLHRGSCHKEDKR